MSPAYTDKCPECGKEFRNYTSISYRLRCSVACDIRAAVAPESIRAPRETLERVRGALAALLREEPLVYEGNLEAKLYVTVDALTDSRIALADLDRLLWKTP